MQKNRAKIISMVPSWTETLIECGLDVVGRTRFCIYPENAVSRLPIVGGTKNLKIDDIVALQPQYVILDREENKKEMAAQLTENGIEFIDSHVTSIASAAEFLLRLGQLFKEERLVQLGEDYLNLEKSKERLSVDKFFEQAILDTNSQLELNNLAYVIWKNPWMLVGSGTYISDVFNCFNLTLTAPKGLGKYPEIESIDLIKNFCLFSTEPYLFRNEFKNLSNEGYRGALIDGEKLSWYGVRSLNFLKSCLE